MAVKEFWIINISNKNVMLADLNISIKPLVSVNLLGKGYSLTLEQLEKSYKTGSIFNKRDKIIKRQMAPGIKEKEIINLNTTTSIPTKTKSGSETIQEVYEELQLSDDDFAEEMADTVEYDRAPILSKE